MSDLFTAIFRDSVYIDLIQPIIGPKVKILQVKLCLVQLYSLHVNTINE